MLIGEPNVTTSINGKDVTGRPQIVSSTPTAPTVATVSPTKQTTIDPALQNFMNNISKESGEKTNLEMPNDLRDAINKVSETKGVPKEVLAAIAHKETGFQNIAEHGGGLGRGYFQIDLGQHPNVTEQQALDPNFATNYAADLIKAKLKRFSKTDTPVYNTIRSYNGGLSNPKTAQYANDVLNKLKTYNFE